MSHRSVLSVILLATAIRLGLVWTLPFDGLYGQDAYAFAEGGVQIAHTFRYTGIQSVGYPALLGVVFGIFGTDAHTAQGVGILLSALTAAVAASLAWHLTRRRDAAWVTGMMMCILPAHIRWSLTVMSDVPALFFLTSGVFCGVRYVQSRWWVWGTGAVICVAVAAIIRYASTLAVIPVIIYAVVSGFRPPSRHLAAGGALGFIFILPEILHMEQMGIQSVYLLQEWDPLNAFRRHFFTSGDGALQYDWPVFIAYTKTLGGWSFFNPIFGGFAIAGVFALRKNKAVLALLLSWICGFYIFLMGLPLVNPRYLLPVVVPVGILCALGLIHIYTGLIRKPPFVRMATYALIGVGIAGIGLGTYRSVGETVARKSCELALVAWINAYIPSGSLIIAFDVAHAAKWYTGYRVLHVHEIEPTGWRASSSPESGVYLIWNEAHAGRVAARRADPGDPIPQFTENFRWLRDDAGHTRIDHVCDWDILRLDMGPEAGERVGMRE